MPERPWMKLFERAALLAALLLTACRAADQPGNRPVPTAAAVAPVLTTPDAIDTASFARPLEARVTHVALDLTVNFEARRLEGTATLDIDQRLFGHAESSGKLEGHFSSFARGPSPIIVA